MVFNQHYDLAGRHALLSPSNYHWLNYDKEKLTQYVLGKEATERGTKLHEYAQMSIQLGERLPKSKRTLNMYVNDAIGYKMDVEIILFYSRHCFGTADAISFREQRGSSRSLLRIHDLKTGAVPASMKQLLIYAALFCLEYSYEPKDIDMELRIYQNNEVLVHVPQLDDEAPENVKYIMDKMIYDDKEINILKGA